MARWGGVPAVWEMWRCCVPPVPDPPPGGVSVVNGDEGIANRKHGSIPNTATTL